MYNRKKSLLKSLCKAASEKVILINGNNTSFFLLSGSRKFHYADYCFPSVTTGYP